MLLSKLSCGVIYTDAFQRYLEEFYDEEADYNPRKIITFEYIRIATGENKGKAWWQLTWWPLNAAPEYRRYRIGDVMVHIPKQAKLGLRERCLDYRNGQVVVLP